MAARRSALGRGLGALIPGAQDAKGPAQEGSPARALAEPGRAEGSQATEAASEPGVAHLPVERIEPNPQQPRRVFDEAELGQLAASLRRHGLLQPVVVRARADAPGRYELVVGERRWRAARLAGFETIPATIKDVAARELLEVALVENVQRRDLNPIELALAFRDLVDAGSTQEQVGQRVGLERSSVANYLRLLELPRELQEDVEAGALGFGHARALLALANPERRRHLRDRIVGEGLSVRAAEELARRLSAPAGEPSKARPHRRRAEAGAVDPDMADLTRQLEDALQTRVRVRGEGSRGGSLEVEFYGPEDLQRLVRRILEGPSPF